METHDPEAVLRAAGQRASRRGRRGTLGHRADKISNAVDARYKSLMVAVVPQPRQMPPPPFDKGALQGIFATVTESYSYQGFGFTPNGRGAQFGNGPDDFVELRPALLRIETKMDGPELLLADMVQEKALRILSIATDGLKIEGLLQCAIQIVASADVPGGDAKTFVAEKLMHGGQQAAKLGEDYFGAAVRFRDLREDGRPDEDELSIEPDVNNNRLLFLDHKMARFAVTGPIGLDDVSTWLSEAFSFVDGPTMDLLENAEGDDDAR
jgi:hypothetical protein